MTCCNSRSCSPSAGCASSPCCQSESAPNAPTAASVVDGTGSAKSKPSTTTSTGSTASEDAAGVILRPLLIRPDNRGSVREAYRASWFPGVPPVAQIVHSESHTGVMRAMHAHARQVDIWHFTRGQAQVQLYDHRDGYWQNLMLDAGHTLVIPPGVSHGFLALEPVTLTYFLTEEYDGSDEWGWQATDADFPGASQWATKRPARSALDYFDTPLEYVRSERDLKAPTLAEFRRKFPR